MISSRVNGTPVSEINLADRAFQYGHGLFETCRLVGGCIPLWTFHRDRLVDSAPRLGISLDVQALEREIRAAIADQPSALVKVIVTAGTSARGYRAEEGAAASRVVMVLPLPPAHISGREGITAHMCATPLAIQPLLAGMKHLNRLEQILARAEWTDPRIAEGLMCDTAGRLVEGTATNIFLVRDGQLITPSLDRCGVAGVMRRLLIEQLLGIDAPVEVRDVLPDELLRADECFVTNAVIGMSRLAHVKGFGAIGRRPGRITEALQTALEARFGFPRPT